MQIITMILSGLAFLAAAAALILVIREKRQRDGQADSFSRRLEKNAINNQKQKAAQLQYTDKAVEAASVRIHEDISKKVDAVNVRIDKLNNALRIINTKADRSMTSAKENKVRIERLEQGIVPDFEEALRAVNAVNDMNKGIANIFEFDPLEALKKSRQEVE